MAWAEQDSISAIYRAVDRYQVPAALLGAIAYCESGYDAGAIGPDGKDYGLFQLRTPGGVGDTCGLSVSQLLNPYLNADCAAWYIRQQRDRLGSWYDAVSAWATIRTGNATCPQNAWNLYQESWWQESWSMGYNVGGSGVPKVIMVSLMILIAWAVL